MVLVIILYKLVRTFESVDKVLKCNDFDENHSAILSGSTLLIPLFSGGERLKQGFSLYRCHGGIHFRWITRK